MGQDTTERPTEAESATKSPAPPSPAWHGNRWAGLLAVLVLSGFAVLTLLPLRPPDPVPSGAPADVFSAERAQPDIAKIAAGIHPSWSAANVATREYLLGRLRELGLTPKVQSGTGERARLNDGAFLASVNNIVATIPGTASTGTVYLTAHYDSVAVGPGATDDAASVAAILEVARVLTREVHLRNDVTLVFTDAEETCLCGAEAFATLDPDAEEGSAAGVMLNLEARGNRGRPLMFETSHDNLGLIRQYAAVVPDPVALSFTVEIYRRLPADTDMTEFNERNIAGLNHALIDNTTAYHTPLDNVDAVSLGSVQALGDTALAEAKAFGSTDLQGLRKSQGDATYFPFLGELFVYPAWAIWPLALIAAVLAIGLAIAGRRSDGLPIRSIVVGFLAPIALIVTAAVAALALFSALAAIRPEYNRFPLGDPPQPGLYRIAVVVLTLAIIWSWYLLMRRWLGPAAVAIGGLCFLALLGVLLAALLPGGAYLATLPALFGSLGLLVSKRVDARMSLFMLTLGALPAVAVISVPAALFFPTMGLSFAAPSAVMIALGSLAVLAVLEAAAPDPRGWSPRTRARDGGQRRLRWLAWIAPAVLLVGTGVFVVTGLQVDTFSPDRPVPSHLLYALNADNGKAIWGSTDPVLSSWSAQYVSGEMTDPIDEFPTLPVMRTGPAPVISLPPPGLTVLSDTSSGGVRTLHLRLESPRDAASVGLYLPKDSQITVQRAVVEGRVTGSFARRIYPFALMYFAPPNDGVDVVLELAHAEGRIPIRVVDQTWDIYNVPGFQPRPAGVGVYPARDADMVVIERTVNV